MPRKRTWKRRRIPSLFLLGAISKTIPCSSNLIILCHKQLEFAASSAAKLDFAVYLECWVSKNNTKLRILKRSTHLGTVHKCSLINSHNTPKRYYYPCYCRGTWELSPPSILHLYDSSSWDASVPDYITILCFHRTSQLHSLISTVGVNGCIHIS